MSQIGTIDCGYLADLQVMAERIWEDPIANIDYKADVESARAVLDNQSVDFSEVTGTKTRVLNIEWAQKCDITTSACSDDCDITGEDVTPKCKPYEIECLQESSFLVPERAYRERTTEQQTSIAKNLLLHKKALDEWLAQYIVTGLVANAGTNAYTGGIGNVAGALTTILPAYWDDHIWGYFNRVIRGNKFKMPYMITGDNLYQLIFNRMHENMTEAGKAAMSKIGSINGVYQDPENVEVIAPNSTFLLHKTAAAFVSKAWNPVGAASAINKAGNYWLWSEPSNNIDGVFYDIIMKESCTDNDFYQGMKVQLHGVFAVNPEPCDDDNTGILQFECGSPETV